MKTRLIFIFIIAAIVVSNLLAQKDKAVFVEPKGGFIDTLRIETDKYYKPETPKKKVFKVDFSKITPPVFKDFKSQWHTSPISQGISGMCWCFSTTSFFESEIKRLNKEEIKLSELYTVYHEYLEKARRFVKERGNSEFGEGSEANAVPRIWKKYGIVPLAAYTGLLPGQKFHNHERMFSEMKNYLLSLKTSNDWNEERALETIASILNHYIGAPPKTVTVNNKEMSPKEYLEKIVRLNLDDYIDFMSLMESPYYQKCEYAVPDNWWHDKNYYNIPLDDFMKIVKRAIRNGYTIVIGGDVSEPGIDGHAGVAVVPSFDIPSENIDENARQFRFTNGTSGDDHGIHLIGYVEKDGKDWYLIKDSGAGSRNNNHPGYYFYNEDFVKLKMLGIMIHRDAAKDILEKFSK